MSPRPGCNARTTLRARRRPADPLAEFDRLPPDLRRWLAGAVLPWSARSARRAWSDALARTGGDHVAALRLMDTRERRRLARDTRAVWGHDHPALDEGAGGHAAGA